MKGDPKVIAALQAAIPMELALSAQYKLDARNLKHLGLKKLGCKLAYFAKDCDRFVGKLADRLLYFDVAPQYSVTLNANTADGLTAMFQAACDAEAELVTAYNESALAAMNAKDDNTRNLFEHLIKFHEQNHTGEKGGAHIEWLEEKLAQIALYGEKEFRLEYI